MAIIAPNCFDPENVQNITILHCTNTHREIFSEFYQIKSKSDCIYHFPIDFEQQTDTVRLLFQFNRKMVNTIWFRFDLLRFRKYFSVCNWEIFSSKTPSNTRRPNYWSEFIFYHNVMNIIQIIRYRIVICSSSRKNFCRKVFF